MRLARPTEALQHMDLARLLLAFGVLLSHSFELIDGDRSREPLASSLGGWSFGVVCLVGFFVLSGNLISASWDRDPHAGRFLLRRVARIVPAFAACSLACALLLGPWVATSASGLPGHYWQDFPVGRYLLSLVLLHGPMIPPVFDGTHYAVVNGAMWSIRLEFRCYLWALGLGWLMLRWPRRMASGWVWGALILGAATLAPRLLEQVRYPGDYWLSAPVAQIVPLLFAFHVGALMHRLPPAWCRHPALPLGGLALLLVHGLVDRWVWPAAGVIVPLAMAALLASLGHARLPGLARLAPPLDVSYGLYLWAWPVQKVLLWQWPTLGPWALTALALAVTLVLAVASARWIEQPALRLARQWLARQRPVTLSPSPAASVTG